MSYTATATRGIAPTSLNLNIFSHPPRSASVHDEDDLLLHERKPKTPSVLTDDEDIFSLDMVTMDMDFDQAYLVYTLMQQKNAMLGVQQLHAAQKAVAAAPPTYQEPYVAPVSDEMDQFFSNTESSALDGFLDRLALLSLLDPHEMYGPRQHTATSGAPFALHTMTSGEQRRDIPDVIKREITDAFKHPPVQSLKSFGNLNYPAYTPTFGNDANTQLPTPHGSRLEVKREAESPDLPRKKRKVSKPLLLLEQKRLNHLHSEQKRRLMCKEAYERCLRLITNVEDYRNELVLALAVTLSKKKLKRKQINKDGLPNLSKHTALCKIAGEMEKIASKNARLRQLLERFPWLMLLGLSIYWGNIRCDMDMSVGREVENVRKGVSEMECQNISVINCFLSLRWWMLLRLGFPRAIGTQYSQLLMLLLRFR